MVDPWGALLAGLLEAPGEEAGKGEQPARAGPAPGKATAKKKR